MRDLLKNLLILLIFITGAANAQGRFQSFLEHVVSLTSNDARVAAVDSFMVYAQGEGIPFIDNDTANYLYRGNVSTVHLAGDMNGWSATGDKFSRLIGTNLFFLRKEYEMNARLDYKIVINGGNWILDPLNPNTCSGGYGPNSELAMPEYVQPDEINYKQGIDYGSMESFVFDGTTLNRNYNVNVYLPNSYLSSGMDYPTVYFQDGGDYVNLAYVKNILDNLIYENKINPVIAVFVTPTNRNDEYAGDNRFLYAETFATELVPEIDSIYRTIKSPASRLVMGDSFGGNISAIISWEYPEIFANCGLHSGAFWPNNYEIYNTIISNDKKDIKYYSVWGTYEGLFTNMRSFRQQLISKGYEFGWNEYPEGHSWGLWRATTDEILEYFFPYSPTSVEGETVVPNTFAIKQNYPNPFNPATVISYSLPEAGSVDISVYSILGEKVFTAVNAYKDAGNHSVSVNMGDYNSGVYIYRATFNNEVQMKKMILIK
ncbi:MAG: hypothetical protein SCALA702_37900 [Melioribacteraceae bacterium]|nr:MAG: hypothetical protein SCALA702_37900 [Melioribacteraceae bacterium]